MSTILVVDDNPTTVRFLADTIAARLGHEVTLIARVEEVTPSVCASLLPHLALVDLSFRGTARSGLDVLMTLNGHSPATRLVPFTQGDDAVAELLRDAWEALPLASAVSKSLPLEQLLELIEEVLRDGSAVPDPVLRPLLPSQRSPWRSAEGYGRLVHHAGHAKLWHALLVTEGEPSYEELRRVTGLKINTLRNYREQLIPELALHGLRNPTIREMQRFARRCRPLLAPHMAPNSR
ncbi:MAG: hypothetical protein ACT4PX_00465 [Actinomycetota bacterium]